MSQRVAIKLVGGRRSVHPHAPDPGDVPFEFIDDHVGADPGEVLAALKQQYGVVPVEGACELRPSLIPGAGRGVFARVDISRGQLITLVPSHIIVYVNCSKEGEVLLHPDVPAHTVDSDAKRRALYQAYGFAAPIAFVSGSPALTDDPRALGHMLNDFDPEDEIESYTGCNGIVFQYGPISTGVSRASGAGGRFSGVIANRDIAAGEELTLSYGYGYWKLNGKPPRTALSSLVDRDEIIRLNYTLGLQAYDVIRKYRYSVRGDDDRARMTNSMAEIFRRNPRRSP